MDGVDEFVRDMKENWAALDFPASSIDRQKERTRRSCSPRTDVDAKQRISEPMPSPVGRSPIQLLGDADSFSKHVNLTMKRVSYIEQQFGDDMIPELSKRKRYAR
jgi:hypothetical protein